MSLVKSVRIDGQHLGIVRFFPLFAHGLGGVLRESQSFIIQKFGNRLEDNRLCHSRVGIIDADQVPQANVVAG